MAACMPDWRFSVQRELRRWRSTTRAPGHAVISFCALYALRGANPTCTDHLPTFRSERLASCREIGVENREDIAGCSVGILSRSWNKTEGKRRRSDEGRVDPPTYTRSGPCRLNSFMSVAGFSERRTEYPWQEDACTKGARQTQNGK